MQSEMQKINALLGLALNAKKKTKDARLNRVIKYLNRAKHCVKKQCFAMANVEIRLALAAIR